MTDAEKEGPAFDVDVVILSLNRTDETLTAVDSALSQKGVSVCVIVVDQGSRPENRERIRDCARKNSRIILRELDRNIGVPGGRNIGIAMAQAPTVCILDNDAVFADETVLARALDAFERERDLGAIAFRIILAAIGQDQNPDWLHPRVRWKADRTDYEAVEVPRFIGAGALFRHKALHDAGNFDGDLFFLEEERDLSARLMNTGWRIMCFADLRVLHNSSPEQRTRWQGGRYYYLVRNQLYCAYKRGDSLLSIAARAAALVLRGILNGLAAQAIRGTAAAIRMVHTYRQKVPEHVRRAHRLKPHVRRRLRELEGRRSEGIGNRIRRFTDPLHIDSN